MNPRFLAISALTLLAACAKPSSSAGNVDSSSQASNSGQDSPLDSQQTDSVPDDTFNPMGYYFPDSEFVVQGIKFAQIDLNGLAPAVRLTPIQDQEAFVDSRCAGVINRDTLSLRCTQTSIGDLSIDGTFLDKRGRYWNWPDIQPERTVVLTALVTIKGPTTVSRMVKFTYWQGD